MQSYSSFEALSLLSKSFHFTDLEPLHPLGRDIGVKRVVSVCINEAGCPEILLADHAHDDGGDFYRLDQLLMSPIKPPIHDNSAAQSGIACIKHS